MKALVILFTVLLSFVEANASTLEIHKKKKGQTQTTNVASQVNREINRHLFNPAVMGKDVNGEAAVMLEVMPEGNLKVVTINTKNPLIQKFVEMQVKKMKIDANELVVGELFRYKLVFRTQ
jgi:hypothetical protein